MDQFKQLEEILLKKHELLSVRVNDESSLHTQHRQFQANKAYLKITLKPKHPVDRLHFHRAIMKTAMEFMDVHAISIQIQT